MISQYFIYDLHTATVQTSIHQIQEMSLATLRADFIFILSLINSGEGEEEEEREKTEWMKFTRRAEMRR